MGAETVLLTPPESDLTTGLVHLCTFKDGARVLVRGDLLTLWCDGTSVTMTVKQWIDAACPEEPIGG